MLNILYIACPYTDPDPFVRQKRAELSMEVAALYVRQGKIVYNPLASHYMDEQIPEADKPDHEFWMNFNAPFMEICSEMIIIRTEGWERSSRHQARNRVLYFAQKTRLLLHSRIHRSTMTKIVLVGEAWGSKEKLFEHAFVGPSGAELARMLAETKLAPEVGIDYPSELDMIRYWKQLREEGLIDIANVFDLHPADNKIETFFTNVKEGAPGLPPLRMGKYVRPDLLHHVENLWRKLEISQPNLVIAFGNTACWAVLGEAKISIIRGTVKISPRLGLKVLPTYHPAAVLHQWNLRTVVLSDLEKAKREAEFNTIKRIERWLLVEPTLQEIANWAERPADFYAADIETWRRKQISMIGIARSDKDAIVIPFIDEKKPGGSYSSTVEEEMIAIRLVDMLLKKPIPKIFQNGVFDLSHLLMFGFRPTMCQEDTMLLHHSLYPEMLKGLGFLGSIYSDEISWKQMRTKGDNLKRDE